ncbi:MAG TPA: L-seryl-tRNA(Sec) selenium transferase [Gemmatimonadaceae bacterium]|nr:L-seryl-tRNA(Sec) selenium transferase [Gemmatimonadaceae bacterium]
MTDDRATNDRRRILPSVSAVLESEGVRKLLDEHPRSVVVSAVREALDRVRSDHSASADAVDWTSAVAEQIAKSLRPSLSPLFNATGVILHTNLGRAPLADAAIDAVRNVAGGFTNLEYDLTTGKRGSRYVHCVELLRELTGAEDAIVVNNCAAALVLALSALSRGREVVISRGELVEIGGSFRVPDIMHRSGATLVEVGTTNRTHAADYRRAITPRTGAFAKIHRSNFTLSGFVSEVGVRDLAPLAREHGIPVVHDLGSGLLIELDEFGLSGEPIARAALDAGATVVLMSGDKLLGGPQAGIAVGSREAISRLRNDPLARALRVDKMTIAALAATLDIYRDRGRALREIPTLAMLTASESSIRERCTNVVRSLEVHGIEANVAPCMSTVGAGAFPSSEIPSSCVRLTGPAETLEAGLRSARVPVIGRIVDGCLILDMRTVHSRDDVAFTHAVTSALA